MTARHPATEGDSSLWYCYDVAEQNEAGYAVFDKSNGYLQLPGQGSYDEMSIAYFSGKNRSPGIMMLTEHDIEESLNFVFQYRDNRWQDVTSEYLGHLGIDPTDYLVVPQYSRAIRVLRVSIKNDEKRFQPKEWLVWDGKGFQVSKAKNIPGWHCPDGFGYYDKADRAKLCN